MSETKFTPGPWVACEIESEHRTLISANASEPEGKNGGIYVAVAQGPDNRANAHLIAAAPDLFEALTEQISECLDPLCEMCARHEAILRKATGDPA